MTEKDYSGTVTGKIGKNAKTDTNLKIDIKNIENKTKNNKQAEVKTNNKNYENYRKAGQIAKQVIEFSKTIIKANTKLSEIAEKIEAKIIELGGEVAFPVNLSIEDIAAHYTPTLRDETLAKGLLNVDIGIHVKGCICDVAFSLDLTSEKKYTQLIKSTEDALKKAIELVKTKKQNTTLNEIGKTINSEITKNNFTTIVNLSGHSLEEFQIHAGLTIPNYETSSQKILGEGAFAIEPFATLHGGSGSIYEGGGSNIYHISNPNNQVRDNSSREVLAFILENKKSLPFSQRELEKKFGTKALIALSNLKRAGIIEEFPQLIEKNHQPVSQAETSFIIYDNQVEVLVE
jgi:methionyl aminopeptidase